MLCLVFFNPTHILYIAFAACFYNQQFCGITVTVTVLTYSCVILNNNPMEQFYDFGLCEI